MNGRKDSSIYIPTRERILLAALRLFSVKGFRGTTMKDIAREVDITEGAIYRHFKSKEEIIEHLIRRVTGEIKELVRRKVLTKGDVVSRAKALAEALLNYALDNPDSFRFLTIYHILKENGRMEKLPGGLLIEAFREAYKKGELGMHPEVAFGIVTGAVEKLFILWELGMVKTPRGTLVEELKYAVEKALL